MTFSELTIMYDSFTLLYLPFENNRFPASQSSANGSQPGSSVLNRNTRYTFLQELPICPLRVFSALVIYVPESLIKSNTTRSN